jgi:hypothetical protein
MSQGIGKDAGDGECNGHSPVTLAGSSGVDLKGQVS